MGCGHSSHSAPSLHAPQIVGSMSPPSTVGRAQLTTRFTARVRVLSMTFPDRDSLQAIYTNMIQQVGPSARCTLGRPCDMALTSLP